MNPPVIHSATRSPTLTGSLTQAEETIRPEATPQARIATVAMPI